LKLAGPDAKKTVRFQLWGGGVGECRGCTPPRPPIIKNFRFFLAKRADFLSILPIFCEIFL
jgi:hypothetical protein